MWIVRLALRRPYTFVVVSILIVIMGGLAIVRTPTDIFPNINIPVVSIIWNYNGLVPEDMSDRIVSVTERALTTTVDNIEHIESQSLYGIAVVKVFLQPTANIQQGIAQITAVSQTQLRQLPAGTTPPLIIAYSASSVPVLQLALSGNGLSEQQLNDYGLNFIRTQLITVPGASVPYPYGGKQRQVQVDLNTTASAVERPVSAGCGQCDQRTEPDPANRNVQDRPQGIRCFHSQCGTADDCRPEPNPDQDDWRYYDLHQRCRLGTRWFSPANQHRACQRAALCLADDPKGGECVNAERDRRHQGPSASN